MANPLRLWINAETGRLLVSSSSFVSAPTPVFYAGDTLPLELHLVAGAGVARVPYEIPFPAGATIKVAVGTVATAPTGGQWRLSVSSTETADLAYNASASAVQTALNALSAVSTAGGVTVSTLGGGYSITWNTVGTKPPILAGSDTLTPASYESILTLQPGDVSTREIIFVELRQTPLALTTTFSTIGTASVSSTIVSAWNGTNKIVRVNLENSPKAGYWTMKLGGSPTMSFKVGAASSEIKSSAISQLLGTSFAGAVSDVISSGQDQFDFVLSSDLAATVNGSGLVSSDAVVGDISFATSELIAFLGSESTAAASLEISTEAAGQNTTYIQVACTVSNAVVAAGAIGPVPVGTLMTETVANSRFVRRDIVDAPSGATQDILWQNLGVTLDGSDTVDAINAAQAPASGNPFLTKSEGDSTYLAINDPLETTKKWMVVWNDATNTFATTEDTSSGFLFLDQGSDYQADFGAFAGYSDLPAVRVTADGFTTWTELNGAGIRFPDGTQQDSEGLTPADAASTYQTLAGMSSYLTTSSASSTYQPLSGMSAYLTTSDASSTYQTISGMSSYLTTTSAASTYLTITNASAIYAPVTDFDQGLKTYNSVTFNSVTFGDLTTQNTRVVREQQANGSGFSTGGFDTAHYPYEVKVIDDNGIAHWVPARLA